MNLLMSGLGLSALAFCRIGPIHITVSVEPAPQGVLQHAHHVVGVAGVARQQLPRC